MKRWQAGACAISAFTLLSPSVSSAQAVTRIIPDSARGATTGTQIQQFDQIHVILNGRLEGSNLYHSFSFFDLAPENVAIWARVEGDGAGIRNIINRVTGGSPSQLEGTFATFGMPNASFYFINPAGIVFGAGASINVPNAAYFSTAGELRFSDGARFSAATPSGSTFTSAAPQAFGFLGEQAGISINGVDGDRFSPSTTHLSFSADRIAIQDSTILAGGFDLFAIGDGLATLDIHSTSHDAAGAGSLRIADSVLIAQRSASAPAGVRIGAAEVQVNASLIAATNGESGEAPGDISVEAGQLNLDGTFFASVTSGDAPGGSVTVNAKNITISSSNLLAITQAEGRTGDVIVKAGNLLVKDGGSIGVQSRPDARGGLGAVAVSADTLTLESNGKINSLSYGEAAAGDVVIAARSALVREGGIQSVTHGGGDAGDISIKAEAVSVGSNGFIQSLAFFGSTGASGAVLVEARDVNVSDGGKISATTNGEGDAGAVSVVASNQVVIAREGLISSDAETLHPTAAAGLVSVKSRTLLLDHGRISTRSIGGNAGSILLETTSTSLKNGSMIGSTAGGAGDAGAVIINTSDLLVEGDSNIDSSTVGEGDGGTVVVNAKNVRLRNGGGISSVTTGPADGGAIFVTADQVSLTDGGYMITSAHRTGNAGGVVLKADSLELLRKSVITAATDGEGAGGFVLIDAKNLKLADGGIISSDALEGGSGNAGSVGIKSEEISIDGVSGISATTSGDGDAGQINIETNKLQMNVGFVTSQTFGRGNAGGVAIEADQLDLKGAGSISSAASAVDLDGRPGGASGNILITSNSVRVADGFFLVTTSRNQNPAGGIFLTSKIVTVDGAKVSSENLSAKGGLAGSISITADNIDVLNGGSVSTNSTAGPAGDISLALPRSGRLRLQGAGARGVITTSSGPGTGGRIEITNPYLILSNGGDILALGQEGGANVQIQSDYFIRSADRLNRLSVDGSLVVESQVGDLSSGTDLVDVSFLDASSVLRSQCSTATSGGASQLTTRALGPYSAAPEGSGSPVRQPKQEPERSSAAPELSPCS